jgi:hypothetical protein
VCQWPRAMRRLGRRRLRLGPVPASTHRAPRSQPATTGHAREAGDSDWEVPPRIPADGWTDSEAPLLLRSTLCGRRAKSRPNGTQGTHSHLLTWCETSTTHASPSCLLEHSTMRACGHDDEARRACPSTRWSRALRSFRSPGDARIQPPGNG